MESFCSSWLWVRFEDDFLIDFYDFCCFGEKYVPCLVWKHPILKTRRRLGGKSLAGLWEVSEKSMGSLSDISGRSLGGLGGALVSSRFWSRFWSLGGPDFGPILVLILVQILVHPEDFGGHQNPIFSGCKNLKKSSPFFYRL